MTSKVWLLLLAACHAPRTPGTPAFDEKAASDLFAPRYLDGPYASLDVYCATVARPPLDDFSPEPDAERRCDLQAAPLAAGRAVIESPPAPYRTVRVFRAIYESETACHLAIQLRDGWYVAEHLAECGPVIHHTRDAVGDELAVRELAFGGTPEVVVKLTQRMAIPEAHERADGTTSFGTIGQTRTYLVLCGIGGSGRPSCTPPMLLADSGFQDDEAMLLDWKMHPDGRLEFVGRKAGTYEYDGDEWEKLQVPHRIVFP